MRFRNPDGTTRSVLKTHLDGLFSLRRVLPEPPFEYPEPEVFGMHDNANITCLIHLGDSDVDYSYDDNFKLYLTTKFSNPNLLEKYNILVCNNY